MSLVSRIRELLGRVTGISTPIGGLSWDSGKSPSRGMGQTIVFTPAEVADVLRLDEGAVLRLLETGELQGLRLDGEWRVTARQIDDFLANQSQAREFERFVEAITSSATWAVVLREDPEFMREVQLGEYPEDSFGRFLQRALTESKRERGVPVTVRCSHVYLTSSFG